MRARLLALAQRAGAYGGHPLALPVSALLSVLLLLPMIHAPYAGDDVYTTEFRGYAKLVHHSFWHEVFQTAYDFVTKNGRPQPLAPIYGLSVLRLSGEHSGAFHFALLLITALSLFLLGKLLIRLGLSRGETTLALLLSAGLVQFRLYHDPLQTFAAPMQLVLIFTLVSLLYFERYLRLGRRRDIVLSTLALLPSLLIYELGYPLVLLHVGLALMDRRGRAAIRAALGPLALTALFCLFSYLARRHSQTDPTGYAVGGGPWTAVRVWVLQLFPPLPTSSIIFDPTAVTGDLTKPELLAATWRALFAATAVVLLTLAAIARPARPGRAGTAVAMLAVGLWVLPPTTLALAPKYQVELGPGRGYIDVLVQGFGVAILITMAVVALARRAQARSGWALAGTLASVGVAIGLLAGITGFNNIRVVAVQEPVRETRSLVVDAARRGIFKTTAPGTPTLFFTVQDLGWTLPQFYANVNAPWASLMLATNDGRVLSTRLQDLQVAEPPLNCGVPLPGTLAGDCSPVPGSAAWVRVRVRGRDTGGSVLIVPFARVGTSRYREKPARTIYAYNEGPGTDVAPPLVVGTTAKNRPWTSKGLTWSKVRGGDGWALYRVNPPARDRPLAGSVNDAFGAIDFTALGPPALRARIIGTKGLLP